MKSGQGAGQLRRAGLLAAVVLAGVSGCAEFGQQSAAVTTAPVQEVGLVYVCGGQFVLTNSGMKARDVSYRVVGTQEKGTARLPGTMADHAGPSSTPIQVRGTGPVEVLENGKRIAREENDRVTCPAAPEAASAQTLALAAAPASEVGRWSAQAPMPIVAVHMHLLPTGKVLAWGRVGDPYVWDPAAATPTFQAVPAPDWLFCAGHAFLPDGKLLVAGGHIADSEGLPDINLFSTDNSWTESVSMAKGRWYPTVTVMGDGKAVITAGTDQQQQTVLIPEVWSDGTITALTGASRNLPYYPRQFLAPNGKIFYAGELRMSAYLDIAGNGRWTNVGNRKYGSRSYGSAVMYAPGKILYAGGGLTTNTTEIINLKAATPAWKYTGAMAFARRHHNLTILPNGRVLATDGVAGTKFNDLTKPVRAAEIWNPDNGTWKTVASSAVPRGYHGTAILLPDGRVLQAGSGAANAPDQKNYEYYSPPYLFKGSRPTISSAPPSVSYGATFRVTTPQAASITRVSLIRLGSVTHAFDQNQRYQSLSFTKDGTGLTVTGPTNVNDTPPGDYMLFILNSRGVPSIASIVHIG